ncbi:MAG: putative transport system ATP-binding protein [Pseudonocardiales bacterium]|nr:putative transport system ATP-binding protein [Pseudonocardiales bacterium]
MIELEEVSKAYRTGGRVTVPALHEVNLSIADGEMVALMGESGSGTSTLMNILSCLDMPTAGHYRLDGTDVGRLSKRRLTKLRGRTVGFVFQSFDLIPDVTVLRNVELPMIYTRARVRRARARRALERVGLTGHEKDMPIELFEAQRQKVLIARALINDPSVLLDDEPTGDLDADSSLEIMELFTELNGAGRTVVFATHREETAAYASRIVELSDGRVVSDRKTGRRRPPPTLRAV